MHKILIIEDEEMVAQDLTIKLKKLGYRVVGTAPTIEEATTLTVDNLPDIYITDIILEGLDYDGIDIINELYELHKAPVIYLTASSENATVKKAMASHPAAFMLKPFRVSEFSINIDLAISNFQSNFTLKKANELISDSIFIPDNFVYRRIHKRNIQYIQADSGYLNIFTVKGEKHNVSTPLKNFERQFSDPNFIRISKSYIVNIDHVSAINGNLLYLGTEKSFKIGPARRLELLASFPILRTK